MCGTCQLINDGFLDERAPKVMKAFKNANTILAESRESVPIDPEMMSRYFYESSSICEALNSEEATLVDSICQKRFKASLCTYDIAKPILLAVLIDLEYHQSYLAATGKFEGITIDKYFDMDPTKRGVDVFY